jgi:hypothetical protein
MGNMEFHYFIFFSGALLTIYNQDILDIHYFFIISLVRAISEVSAPILRSLESFSVVFFAKALMVRDMIY